MALPLRQVCRPSSPRAVYSASRTSRPIAHGCRAPSMQADTLISSHSNGAVVMSSQQWRRSSSSSSSSPSMPSPAGAAKREAPVPRPSSSIVLLSPTNEVLLLHRTKTSTSFASAYVFPGGNLDAFHDGAVPGPDAPERHRDGPAYRLGAIRECFEETGILLAKRDGALVDVAQREREEARRQVNGSRIRFAEWLRSIGAEADTDGLIPFTRWLTPVGVPKRFTTQMYLYQLPISRSGLPSEMLVPTPDGGVEHTAAVFAPPQTFLSRADAGGIVVFPPQYYLLALLARFLTTPTGPLEERALHAVSQRRKLLEFLETVPTADTDRGKQHPTASISWANKAMSPHLLLVRGSDSRRVLALDKPGPELKDSGRGGDWERVVLVEFGKGGPSRLEIRRREDVLQAEKTSSPGGSRL